MKILDIVVIKNSGFSNITCKNLSDSSRYKVLKFKNIIDKAFENIQGLEKCLLESNNIQDMQEFESNLKKLEDNKSRTKEEEKKYKEMVEQRDSYLNVRMEMLKDEYELTGIKPISYEEWFELRKENRPTDGKEIITNYIEDALKGVFWVEPDE